MKICINGHLIKLEFEGGHTTYSYTRNIDLFPEVLLQDGKKMSGRLLEVAELDFVGDEDLLKLARFIKRRFPNNDIDWKETFQFIELTKLSDRNYREIYRTESKKLPHPWIHISVTEAWKWLAIKYIGQEDIKRIEQKVDLWLQRYSLT